MYPSTDKASGSPVPDATGPPQPAIGIPVNSTALVSKPPAAWSSGLFGCFQDGHSCLVTAFCPCITFGRIAEVVDKGSTSCALSGAIYTLILVILNFPGPYTCLYRKRLRAQYNLEGATCTDCLVHCCCEQCALCQEYRELQNQGYDMKLGWKGNEEKNNGLAAPDVQGGMTR